ncbi:DUF2993 domain-containing protein [Leptolyngbya sp. FACHB-36]|uniref:LmeA family phospholipid-binding protein n=1 Tax=Leptolyngbya sp. FACHB-36 TaxID=2692808 RepID=UPI001681B4F5|nr:DUF2993 domain-containing protein [Leptolyngbya sp. FACHB-36]MBD2022649.1 DUF2993 domain-containing protein [Leptolyngbya sp. FACHB-36]
MEFLTIFLSSLISLVSPVGVVLDRTAQQPIRRSFVSVETLEVRIDNAPSYQLVQGKVDRIRIAGRGLFPVQEVRLEALELDTDPIFLEGRRLLRGRPQLTQPARAAVRLVLTEADINRALRSPAFAAQLREVGINALSEQDARQARRYEILNPRVEFESQRIRVSASLREAGDPATLDIMAEAGIETVAGRQLRLVNPTVRLNGEAVPDRVVTPVANGIAERSDLRQLEASGITARILQLHTNADQLQLAAFVQVAPNKF